MISIYDPSELRSACDRRGLPGRHLRSLLSAFFRRGQSLAHPVAGVPEAIRAEVVSALLEPRLRQLARLDSEIDGATKLVFETAAGGRFETVVLRYPYGRTSVCISSQIGCPLRCRFCATGQMERSIDLGRDEILEQVTTAQQILVAERRTLDNIVFMGMGEPLLNEASVFAAIGVLIAGQAFNLAPESVLLSTVLLPRALERFQREYPQVNIAISLHSSRQQVRERIMPIAARYPLESLRPLIAELASTRRKGVMIEYVVLQGVNDSIADMDHLARYLNGIRCHVNLIPFNSIEPLSSNGDELRGASEVVIDSLSERLRWHGLPVTRRNSLGRDIEAACGQLIQKRYVDSLQELEEER